MLDQLTIPGEEVKREAKFSSSSSTLSFQPPPFVLTRGRKGLERQLKFAKNFVSLGRSHCVRYQRPQPLGVLNFPGPFQLSNDAT